jgi:hypothetical protein
MALLPWSLAPGEGTQRRTSWPGRWLFRSTARGEARRATAIAWCCVALFASVDVAWLMLSSLHFHPANWSILAAVTAAAVVGRAAALLLARRVVRGTPRAAVRALARKLALLGRFGLLLVLLVAGFVVFSYLATAASLPLRDNLLADLDEKLGFNWMVFLAIANASPVVANVLSIGYHSTGAVLLAVVVWLAVTEQEARLSELLAVLALTFAGLAIGMVAVPTAGAFAHFAPPAPQFSNFPDASQMWPFYRTFAALRDGTLGVIDLSASDGIVSFPSFHAALGVVTLWSLRGHRRLFWPALVLNAVMLVAVLPVGGHHLCELIGGVLTGLAAIALVHAHRLPVRAADRESFLNAYIAPATLLLSFGRNNNNETTQDRRHHH